MQKLVRKIGQAIYRIWFYILVALPILVFFPFLLVTTLSEKTYPQFFWLARNVWAKTILFGMFCFPKVKYQEKITKGKSYMLIANHTSMLDIMLMLYVSKNPFVFVGKEELSKIPLFGFFYKRVCILVNRKDPKSRTAVYRRVQHKLNQGFSICIFPEGGVPEENILLDTFKDGAFRMATKHNIPIVPITFLDCKKRFPWTFFSGGPGILRAKVHYFVDTELIDTKERSKLRVQIRETLLKELTKDELESVA